MTIYTNSGLKMTMESAIAAAVAITSLSNAAPGVVGKVAHGLSDGDVVLLQVEGITELDGRLFIVYNKGDDQFELADVGGASGLSTVGMGVFTSGTFEVVTLGTSVGGVADLQPSGGDPKFVDTTTVHDKTDKQIVVGASAMSFELSMQWDPANAAQAAMRAAFQAAASKGFKVLWPNGTFMLFYGTVGFTGMTGGASQGVTTSPAAITLEGNPTYV